MSQPTTYPDTFTEIELIIGDRRVIWEYIDEGQNGDYDPDDPEDVPLLRFSCYQKSEGEWEELPNSSYCTRMAINSNRKDLVVAAMLVLEAVEDSSYKRRLEELSWLQPEDFKPQPDQNRENIA